ncbi:MAG: S8 family serine peptidase [Fretibacterium sp.]|nr:S8 family serine peptidase [Fretibacterium sp.]
MSDLGVGICVAAGNDAQRVGCPAICDDEKYFNYTKGNCIYPASFRNIENMIVVAAASRDVSGNIVRSSFSSFGGIYVDIAAPGVGIVSPMLLDYSCDDPSEKVGENVPCVIWNGTSMAAPHVNGAAVLLKSAWPSAAGAQIRKALPNGANGNCCRNDRDTAVCKGPDHQTKNDTSRCGFLDVKAVYALLPQMIREETAYGSSSHSGRDMGLAGLYGLALLGASALLEKVS